MSNIHVKEVLSTSTHPWKVNKIYRREWLKWKRQCWWGYVATGRLSHGRGVKMVQALENLLAVPSEMRHTSDLWPKNSKGRRMFTKYLDASIFWQIFFPQSILECRNSSNIHQQIKRMYYGILTWWVTIQQWRELGYQYTKKHEASLTKSDAKQVHYVVPLPGTEEQTTLRGQKWG